MDVYDIVAVYLSSNDLDGLIHPEKNCRCYSAGLMDCPGNDSKKCIPIKIKGKVK